jgi:hypothetical protein
MRMHNLAGVSMDGHLLWCDYKVLQLCDAVIIRLCGVAPQLCVDLVWYSTTHLRSDYEVLRVWNTSVDSSLGSWLWYSDTTFCIMDIFCGFPFCTEFFMQTPKKSWHAHRWNATTEIGIADHDLQLFTSQSHKFLAAENIHYMLFVQHFKIYFWWNISSSDILFNVMKIWSQDLLMYITTQGSEAHQADRFWMWLLSIHSCNMCKLVPSYINIALWLKHLWSRNGMFTLASITFHVLN